MFFSSLVANLN